MSELKAYARDPGGLHGVVEIIVHQDRKILHVIPLDIRPALTMSDVLRDAAMRELLRKHG